MKKKKNGVSENGDLQEEVKEVPQYAIPEGYEEKSSDLVGFWNQDQGPLHFIPRSARAFDNKTEPTKSSILVMGEAVGENPIVNQDDERFDCHAGDMIGVWFKPGMVSLKDLADVRVFMYPSGEKDTGKPNPMITYKIASNKPHGTALYITEDFRKKSKHTSLPFPVKGPAARLPAKEAHEDTEGSEGVPY